MPPVPDLLVIDSFAHHVRGSVLEQAVAHRPGVWVLRQHVGNREESVLEQLRRVARLQAESPKKSRVLHQASCWETATWDVELSRFSTQLWKLNTTADTLLQTQFGVMQHLDYEGSHRYAFHWSEDPTPRLLVHRQHQQDALRHSWDGLVAGTDGSVVERTEVMGAGCVLGADPLPIISFFARVGGPLASARADAASLLQLLWDVRQRYNNQVHLLIFVDCLVVLLGCTGSLQLSRVAFGLPRQPDPSASYHSTWATSLAASLRGVGGPSSSSSSPSRSAGAMASTPPGGQLSRRRTRWSTRSQLQGRQLKPLLHAVAARNSSGFSSILSKSFGRRDGLDFPWLVGADLPVNGSSQGRQHHHCATRRRPTCV